MNDLCKTCKGEKDIRNGVGPPKFACALDETELKQAVHECPDYEKRTSPLNNKEAVRWARNKQDKADIETQKSLIVYDKKLGLAGLVVGFGLGLITKSYFGC